jgi:hypothetical protein
MDNPKARQRFAEANGWTIAKHSFGLDTLARGGVHGRGYPGRDDGHVDHSEWYRKDGHAIAIVGHPYPEDKTYLQGVEQRNLIVHHAPAGAAASWYSPGHTLLIVITRPGVEVVWPTEKEMAEND